MAENITSNPTQNFNNQQAQEGKMDWGPIGDYKRPWSYQSQQNGSYAAVPGGGGEGEGEGGGGRVNIVKDFRWTFSQFREETPRIRLIERQILERQQLDFIMKSLAAATAGGGNDPYAGLYSSAKKTGFEYILPYIPATYHSQDTTWSEKVPAQGQNLFLTLGQKAANKLGIQGNVEQWMNGGVAAIDAANSLNIPGIDRFFGDSNAKTAYVGVDQPMYYSGTSKQTYNISFPLYNTARVEDIRANFDFITLFAYQNYHNRTSFVTYNPPVIYEVTPVTGYMGGIGYKPAMHVRNFSVKNIGSVRAIDIGGESKTAVPEAYQVDIQLAELITTSRAIYSSVMHGNSIVNVY